MRGDTSKDIGDDTVGAKDSVDRAIDSLRRHTDQIEADTKAVGLGDAALAKFRAEALETAAVQANGGKETADQAASFKELEDRAEAAAGALARARVANTISRGQQTALLSPEDVQIANALKGIYPDVATALGSVEASALRANQSLSQVSSEISGDLTSGLTDITTGAKTAQQGFADMAASIIKDIEQMIIKLTIVQPLMQGLQGFIGGGISLSGAGFNPIAGITGHATGGPISGPGTGTSDSIPTRLSNGEYVVNAEAARDNRGLLDAINYGKGYAAGGVVGSQITPDMPETRAGGGNVTVINQTGVQADAETQTGPNGDMTIVLKKMIDEQVGDSLMNGTGRRVLGIKFGVKPFMGR